MSFFAAQADDAVMSGRLDVFYIHVYMMLLQKIQAIWCQVKTVMSYLFIFFFYMCFIFFFTFARQRHRRCLAAASAFPARQPNAPGSSS